MELAGRYEESFHAYEDTGVILTPYATAYRYPGESGSLEPSRAEFDEACKLSSDLFTFVLSMLPEEVRPAK